MVYTTGLGNPKAEKTTLLETEIDGTLWLGEIVPGLAINSDRDEFIAMLGQEYRNAALRVVSETDEIKQAVISEKYISDILLRDQEVCNQLGYNVETPVSRLECCRDLYDSEGASVLKIVDQKGRFTTVFVDRTVFDKFCAEGNYNPRTEGKYLFLKEIGVYDGELGEGPLELIFSDSPMVHMPFN
jgi:hypothetical protein